MAPRRKQTLLFLVCVVALLAAGYGSGYATAYAHFYSVSALMDNETLDLDFNTRLLHYANANQSQRVRSKLLQRVFEQVHYLDQIIATSDDTDAVRDAAASLKQARAALSQPLAVPAPVAKVSQVSGQSPQLLPPH